MNNIAGPLLPALIIIIRRLENIQNQDKKKQLTIVFLTLFSQTSVCSTLKVPKTSFPFKHRHFFA